MIFFLNFLGHDDGCDYVKNNGNYMFPNNTQSYDPQFLKSIW